MTPSKSFHYFMHAFLGGALGFFASLIFLIIYYGQQFTLPVSDEVRLKSAFWATVFILGGILIVFYRKQIGEQMRNLVDQDEYGPE